MVETQIPPLQVDPPIHIGAPNGVSPLNIHPPVTKIDDQHDAFFNPRTTSQNDAFGPATNEVEKKVRVIEENLNAMESTDALDIDAYEMCLVSGVFIPTKFKVPDFEMYKGANDPRTHIQAYCGKMPPTLMKIYFGCIFSKFL